MPSFTLFGTLTSPYVRRVRIVAHELGLPTELVDTFSDAGQAALRELSPIWKVPAARIDGVALFDSAVITQHLLQAHGPKHLTPFDAGDVVMRNMLTVTDGALDALINVFYLRKDGISPEQAPYVAKQQARASSAMRWLDARVTGTSTGGEDGFGLAEIALYTSIDWMRFRDSYDVSQHPNLVSFTAAHATRPSIVATAPPAPSS